MFRRAGTEWLKMCCGKVERLKMTCDFQIGWFKLAISPLTIRTAGNGNGRGDDKLIKICVWCLAINLVVYPPIL